MPDASPMDPAAILKRADEIEARLAQVSPFPWQTVDGDEAVFVVTANAEPAELIDDDEGDVCKVRNTGPGSNPDDAEFIARAPADVRYLLTQLRLALADTRRVDWIEKNAQRLMSLEVKPGKYEWRYEISRGQMSGPFSSLRKCVDAAMAATPREEN